MNRLTLRDELYLLAHDDRGEPRVNTGSLSIGLAGAILIDLVLGGRATVEPGRLIPRDARQTGDAINDWVLTQLVNEREVRHLRWWIGAVADDAYDRTTSSLHASGIIAKVTYKKLLGSVTRNQLTNETLAVQARARVWSAINGREQPDLQCAALAGMLSVLRLEGSLNMNVPGRELLSRLAYFIDWHQPPVREIMTTVHAMIGEAATSAYR